MNMQPTMISCWHDAGGYAISEYSEMVGLLERLHRQILELVRRELEKAGIHEINPVQGMLLFNIGPQTVTAGDLTSRGYYQGSNVSYNLKKLTQLGYVECERSKTDRRSVRVRLTEKAMNVHLLIASVMQRHAQQVTRSDRLGRKGVGKVNRALHVLDVFWNEESRAAV